MAPRGIALPRAGSRAGALHSPTGPMHTEPMTRSILLLGLGLGSSCASTSPAQTAVGGPGLEALAALEGVWVEVGENGASTGRVTNVFRTTAGGSAVSEVVFPGEPEEMLTVYQAGRRGLELTHYCAAGNAPRMLLDEGSTAEDLRFTCIGGVGLEDHATGHMHTGRIVVLGPDRLRTEWAFLEAGENTFTGVFEIQRVDAGAP